MYMSTILEINKKRYHILIYKYISVHDYLLLTLIRLHRVYVVRMCVGMCVR